MSSDLGRTYVERKCSIMTFNSYLPPKSYAFLVSIAEKYKLSVKEVQRIFINAQATVMGFNCEHTRIGYTKKDPQHKPFCKDCWARMESVDRSVFDGKRITKKREFLPLETFLDIHYREQSNNTEVQKTN